MKTGKESKPPGHVHRQQLFHWIGGDLDKQNGNRKVLKDDLVDECLRRLRGSLELGLWVKSPRFPSNSIFEGSTFPLTPRLPASPNGHSARVYRTRPNTAGLALAFPNAG